MEKPGQNELENLKTEKRRLLNSFVLYMRVTGILPTKIVNGKPKWSQVWAIWSVVLILTIVVLQTFDVLDKCSSSIDVSWVVVHAIRYVISAGLLLMLLMTGAARAEGLIGLGWALDEMDKLRPFNFKPYKNWVCATYMYLICFFIFVVVGDLYFMGGFKNLTEIGLLIYDQLPTYIVILMYMVLLLSELIPLWALSTRIEAAAMELLNTSNNNTTIDSQIELAISISGVLRASRRGTRLWLKGWGKVLISCYWSNAAEIIVHLFRYLSSLKMGDSITTLVLGVIVTNNVSISLLQLSALDEVEFQWKSALVAMDRMVVRVRGMELTAAQEGRALAAARCARLLASEPLHCVCCNLARMNRRLLTNIANASCTYVVILLQISENAV